MGSVTWYIPAHVTTESHVRGVRYNIDVLGVSSRDVEKRTHQWPGLGACWWPPFEESIQGTLNQLVHNWFKCIVYTQPTNEFKPQPGPNFLFAQVGYRNRVLTSHILQILGRPSNIRGCEKTPNPTPRSPPYYIKEYFWRYLQPFLWTLTSFAPTKMYERKIVAFFLVRPGVFPLHIRNLCGRWQKGHSRPQQKNNNIKHMK